MAKVQISIDDELLSRVDDYADTVYMSRSGFFSLAAVKYLNENQMLSGFKKLVDAVEDIVKGQNLTAQQKKDLEELRVLSEMISSAKIVPKT